mgnify:CR=1 FL=1
MAELSVIVPVYNIRPYLPKCLESICNQTFENIEIILVDDGSTDGSGELCDIYSEQDRRIVVIHKKNGGVVSARKAGIQAAGGDYITFVDGDDWLDLDCYEQIMQLNQGFNADMIAYGYVEEYPDFQKECKNKMPEGFYRNRDLETMKSSLLMTENFFEWGVLPQLWNKLMKADVAVRCHERLDDTISYGEDVAAVFLAMLDIKSFLNVDKCGYHYRQHLDSCARNNHEVVCENFIAIYRILKHVFAGDRGLNEQLKLYMHFILLLKKYSSFSEYMPLFPFGKVKEHERVFVYGAGVFGKVIAHAVKFGPKLVFAGWTDRRYDSPALRKLSLDPYHVILKQEYDRIVIAILNERVGSQVEAELISLGVLPEKIEYVKGDVLKSHDLPEWLEE